MVGRTRRKGEPMVSHGRIYQFVKEDKKNGGTLYTHLRYKLKYRKRPLGEEKVGILDKVSIEMRGGILSTIGNALAIEIDTVIGKGKKALL